MRLHFISSIAYNTINELPIQGSFSEKLLRLPKDDATSLIGFSNAMHERLLFKQQSLITTTESDTIRELVPYSGKGESKSFDKEHFLHSFETEIIGDIDSRDHHTMLVILKPDFFTEVSSNEDAVKHFNVNIIDKLAVLIGKQKALQTPVGNHFVNKYI